ncbi:PREDICTED: transmembrane protein 81 [Chaetura pelagica]|uniref:transmembrane protein 81 n=1 Tax=Chaetura pelagica TaxID=8897 RepID=UPI0005238231|nr:PREDICTED: transmembrane protein 81 [Chaetura pelagica]
MKTSGNHPVLGAFCCAFYLPLVASMEKVTIPAELRTAMAEIAVNTTSCSVTCGPGYKLERLCSVTATGERRNCTIRRSGCLTTWACGMVHFTIPVGKPFQFNCLSPDEVGFEREAYFYTWRFAQSLITMNDMMFKPLKNTESLVRLSPARESDAGTYRCDMQLVKTFRVIKRIYFGVRVIQNELVNLNFQKSLTWEQKVFYDYLVGIGSGVIGGTLVGMVLCCVQRFLRRAANKPAKI